MKRDYVDHFLGSCAVALAVMLVVLVPLARAEDGESPCDNPQFVADCAAQGKICYQGECIENPCSDGKVYINGECTEPPLELACTHPNAVVCANNGDDPPTGCHHNIEGLACDTHDTACVCRFSRVSFTCNCGFAT